MLSASVGKNLDQDRRDVAMRSEARLLATLAMAFESWFVIAITRSTCCVPILPHRGP